MGKIILLDEQTANQIAAGEVVEGPASVVKEMVENAVDAGATQIQVEIRNGGIRSIRVTDNGSGMERDDVEMAFERHATSKIRQIGDLDAIRSMGFRGEALASIASVSRLEMLTRTAEEPHGTRVVIEGGRLESVEPAGAPIGTTFLVRDLFFNTPARYKFLKKDSTEAARVTDVLERLALAHPDVSISLRTNNEPVLRTPGNGDLASCIYSLYGKDTADALLPLAGSHEGITVTGFVGRPTIARGNRGRQTILMNGRAIRSGTVTAALDEAFKTLLMTRQFAFAVIVLDVPPMRVDVNVHPAKLEVRFSEEGAIFSAVHAAVRNALAAGAASGVLAPVETLGHGRGGMSEMPWDRSSAKAEAMAAGLMPVPGRPPATFRMSPPTPAVEQQRFVSAPSVLPAHGGERIGASIRPEARADTAGAGMGGTPSPVDLAGADSPRSHVMTEAATAARQEAAGPGAPSPAGGAEAHGAWHRVTDAADAPPRQDAVTAEAPPQCGAAAESQAHFTALPEAGTRDAVLHPAFLEMRIAGQVFDSFIVLEHGDEMLLLDQHAAHERIRFERLRESLASGRAVSQTLLQPATLHLSAIEYEAALPSLDMLRRLGFDIETFGRDTLRVRAVPATFDGGLSETELTAIVTDWPAEAGRRQGAVSDEVLHLVACKGAIKANHALSALEVRALLERLATLENPYTCVHGRPILLRFPRRELEKRFRRIV